MKPPMHRLSLPTHSLLLLQTSLLIEVQHQKIEIWQNSCKASRLRSRSPWSRIFLTEIGHLPDFYPGMCTVDRADTWLPTQLPALLQRSSFPPPQWFMLWTMCHCPIITTQGVPSGGASTKQSPSNHLKLDTFMDSRDSSRLQEPWMDQRPSIPPQDGLCHYYFPAQREKTSQVAAGESWMTKLKMT